VSLRLLCDRREELSGMRAQAVCRLHRLLAELTPGGMRRELSAGKAEALLARIRPGDDVGRIRLQLARDHLADIRALDARLKATRTQIAALVAATGTTLTSLFGAGSVIAGRLLAETADVTRFATKDTFASCNGTAPIDASSGEQVRHRLSRAGNRRINHALHMMAVTQIRYPATKGRLYYERKRTEGKTPKEALRCLKRRLSDVVYRQLIADRRDTIEECGSPTTPQPTPSTSTSPAARSRRAHHPPGQHPARRRSIHRARLERRPARRPRNPRRQQPPAPRPPRGSRNHQLTAPRDTRSPPTLTSGSPIQAPTSQPAARSCPRTPERNQRQGRAAGPPAGCLDAGEHRRTLAQQESGDHPA
jgi:transposase